MADDLDQHYALTDHACRACCGPILRSGQRFVCAVCSTAAAYSPVPICGCGLRPMKGVSEREGYFRCILNPAPSKANPARVVIGFACEGDSPPMPKGVAISDPLAAGQVTPSSSQEVSVDRVEEVKGVHNPHVPAARAVYAFTIDAAA